MSGLPLPKMLRGPNFGLVLLLALFLVMLEWLFLTFVLNYDSEGGDISEYWRNSLHLGSAFEPHHMPGYPLAIAAVRGVLGNFLSPQAIMLAITLVSLSVAMTAVYRIAQFNLSPDKTWIGLLAVTLFVLWPLVGMTYVATPIADMFSMALLLLGWWLLLRERALPAAILLGLAIVSHKGMWPFAMLLMAGHIFTVKSAASFVVAGVMVLPIATLWILGTIHNGSPMWMFSADIDWAIRSHSSVPVLDGVVGSMLFGGLVGLVKGVIVLGVALLALAVLLKAWLFADDGETKWYSSAVALSVILSVLILNEEEIWAIVRFGRLLAVPLAMLYGTLLIRALRSNRGSVCGLGLGIAALFCSQLAFAYYMARVWAPDNYP